MRSCSLFPPTRFGPHTDCERKARWPAEYGPVHQLDFRALQQQLRVSEVAAALEVLNRINDGEGAAVACENRRTDLGGKEVVGRYLPEWKGRIDFANVTMAGHSFGGGTTVRFFSLFFNSNPGELGYADATTRRAASWKRSESAPPFSPSRLGSRSTLRRIRPRLASHTRFLPHSGTIYRKREMDKEILTQLTEAASRTRLNTRRPLRLLLPHAAARTPTQ